MSTSSLPPFDYELCLCCLRLFCLLSNQNLTNDSLLIPPPLLLHLTTSTRTSWVNYKKIMKKKIETYEKRTMGVCGFAGKRWQSLNLLIYLVNTNFNYILFFFKTDSISPLCIAFRTKQILLLWICKRVSALPHSLYVLIISHNTRVDKRRVCWFCNILGVIPTNSN